jgi:hypothetical protein
MSKHTPGPWARDHFRQIAGKNGQVVYVDDFTFGSHSTKESQANTRRIVACINACEGFSIEELEDANLFKDSIESQSEIIALKKQRDDLIVALKQIQSATVDAGNINTIASKAINGIGDLA